MTILKMSSSEHALHANQLLVDTVYDQCWTLIDQSRKDPSMAILGRSQAKAIEDVSKKILKEIPAQHLRDPLMKLNAVRFALVHNKLGYTKTYTDSMLMQKCAELFLCDKTQAAHALFKTIPSCKERVYAEMQAFGTGVKNSTSGQALFESQTTDPTWKAQALIHTVNHLYEASDKAIEQLEAGMKSVLIETSPLMPRLASSAPPSIPLPPPSCPDQAAAAKTWAVKCITETQAACKAAKDSLIAAEQAISNTDSVRQRWIELINLGKMLQGKGYEVRDRANLSLQECAKAKNNYHLAIHCAKEAQQTFDLAARADKEAQKIETNILISSLTIRNFPLPPLIISSAFKDNTQKELVIASQQLEAAHQRVKEAEQILIEANSVCEKIDQQAQDTQKEIRKTMGDIILIHHAFRRAIIFQKVAFILSRKLKQKAIESGQRALDACRVADKLKPTASITPKKAVLLRIILGKLSKPEKPKILRYLTQWHQRLSSM